MLKPLKPDGRPESVKKLNSKMFGVHVTNVCNLHCGGCDQFCGYFDKSKLFFISLDELRKNIGNFLQYRAANWSRLDFPEDDKVFLLYGGEPTLHPKFDELLNMLYEYKDIPFCIYTNGRTFEHHFQHIDLDVSGHDISRAVYKTESLPRTGFTRFSKLFSRFHSHDRNVAYRIDYKTPEVKSKFAPVLCAPVDLEKTKLNKLQMWKRAQEGCYKWTQCENSIYMDKAYGCNVAASMDQMFYGGKHGWDVKDGENPFDKTEEELNEQMKHFCYRCGYNCLGGMDKFEEDTEKNQYIHKGTMVTKTNMPDMDKNSPNAQRLDLVQLVTKKVPPEVFR